MVLGHKYYPCGLQAICSYEPCILIVKFARQVCVALQAYFRLRRGSTYETLIFLAPY